MRTPAPRVRESINDRQGASSDQRKKEKKRRGYEATQNTDKGTLFSGTGSSQGGGSKTLLG